jgi:type IV pilus assembly protein PilV
MLTKCFPVKHQYGVGLIEVLTSLLILSIGILGVITLQSRTLQFSQGALYESRATILAGDIMDRIRANPGQASNYAINLTAPTPTASTCYGAVVDCSPAQLANYDRASWRQTVAAVLPQGLGEVLEVTEAGGAQVYIITIQYSDSRIEDASPFSLGNAPSPKQITFKTSI